MVRLRLASTKLHGVLSQLIARVKNNATATDSHITDDLVTAMIEVEMIREAIDDLYGPPPAEDE